MNDESLPLDVMESMQFFHTLERFLKELLLAKPELGPLFLDKTYISDGFYRIDIAPSDIPKLGLIFPRVSKSSNPDDYVVDLPLVLLVWTTFPSIFITSTETVSDNTNGTMNSNE